MPTNQASSFRKPQGSTTNAKFALVITRDSLDSKDRLEITSRSTNAPRDQLSVPCLLFLHYLQTLARLDLPLWHQWRDYRHLSNFVHLRFINLGPEERSYRQMFFVFKSNDTLVNQLDESLNKRAGDLRIAGMLYVSDPWKMPELIGDEYFCPLPLVGKIRQFKARAFRYSTLDRAMEMEVTDRSSIQLDSTSTSSPPALLSSNSRPATSRIEDGNESDDPIALTGSGWPSTQEPESSQFALVIGKWLISEDQTIYFREDSNKRSRLFWNYLKDYGSDFRDEFLGKPHAPSEIAVSNRLVRVSRGSFREVFFLQSRRPGAYSKAKAKRLKSILADQKDEMRRSRAKIIFIPNPGNIPSGHLYMPAPRFMDDLRTINASSIRENLLPEGLKQLPKPATSSGLNSTSSSQRLSSTATFRHPRATSESTTAQTSNGPISSRRGRVSTSSNMQIPTSEVIVLSSAEEDHGSAQPSLRTSAEPIYVGSDSEGGNAMETVRDLTARTMPVSEIIDLTQDGDDDGGLIGLATDSMNMKGTEALPGRDVQSSGESIQEPPISSPELEVDELDAMELDSRPASELSFQREARLPYDAGSIIEQELPLGTPLRQGKFSASSTRPQSVFRHSIERGIISQGESSTQRRDQSPEILLYFQEEKEEVIPNSRDVFGDYVGTMLSDVATNTSQKEQNRPPFASEPTTDVDEVEDDTSADPAAGCTEWAKEIAKYMKPEVAKRYLAKARRFQRDELDSRFADMMRDQLEEYRSSTYNRQIFESWILQSTLDEPDAPVIGVKNNVDSEPCPAWEFVYTNKLIRGDGVPKPPSRDQMEGCSCLGGCYSDPNLCTCAKRQAKWNQGYRDDLLGFNYDSKGELQDLALPIFECNNACSCAIYCRNRVAQRGRQYRIDIRKTENRGWGVFAAEKIPKGAFLGIYSGELLLDAEAEVRGKVYNKYNRTYLFDIDDWYLKEAASQRGKKYRIKYAIDAMHAGCFTRFLNHSCWPNSVIVPCVFGEAEFEIPYHAFFTRVPIEPDEEITFSYKGFDILTPAEEAAARKRVHDRKLFKRVQKQKEKIYVDCQCGSWNCNGLLWTEGSGGEEDDSELHEEGSGSEDSI